MSAMLAIIAVMSFFLQKRDTMLWLITQAVSYFGWVAHMTIVALEDFLNFTSAALNSEVLDN